MNILFRWITLSYFKKRPLKLFLTLLGMASGIAVFTAIQLANQSILNSFTRSIDQLKGSTQITLVHREGRLSHEDYRKVRELSQIETLSPYLKASAQVVAIGEEDNLSGSPELEIQGTLLGIDPLAYGRLFREGLPKTSSQGFLKLMQEPGFVLLPESYWERYLKRLPKTSLKKISKETPQQVLIQVLGQKAWLPFETYEDEGSLWEGADLILIDLASFQESFPESLSQLGQLSGIDLQLKPGVDPQTWIQTWTQSKQKQLPSDLVAQDTSARNQQAENILAAFQKNLLSLGLVSIFVAVFIVYNATSLSVLYRRKDLGVLRTLGLSRRQIGGLFFIETLLLATLSALLGILLGWGLAKLIFSQVLNTVQQLYVPGLQASLSLNLLFFGETLLLSLVAASLGALLPLFEVLKISPVEATRKFSYEKHLKRHPVLLFSLSLAMAALAAFAYHQASLAQPYWGFITAFAILLTFIFLTPFVLKLGSLPLKFLAKGFCLPNLQITASQFQTTPYRFSVVTAALALAIALWIGIGMMVFSFRQTVVQWIEDNIRGDIYLVYEGQETKIQKNFIPTPFLKEIEQLPQVTHVDRLRRFEIEIDGQNMSTSAIELGELMERGAFQLLSGERSSFSRKLPKSLSNSLSGNFADIASSKGRAIPVALSESLARRQNLKVEDPLQAQTPWGPWTLQVKAILYDYSSEQGILYLDFQDFVTLTQDPRVEGLALLLADANQEKATLDKIKSLPDYPQGLEANLNLQVRKRILKIFDETFAVTQALSMVALIVAFLGILTTLALVVEEKKVELAMLRSFGMSQAQLSRFALTQGLALATLGYLLAALMGISLCWILLKVIHYNFFGWSIFFYFSPKLLLQSGLLTFATGGLASLWAFRTLAKLNPVRVLQEE